MAGRLWEEGVFEAGPGDDAEFIEGETHLQRGGIFFEQGGVEHGGVVGGKGDGNSVAEESGKRVIREFAVRRIELDV